MTGNQTRPARWLAAYGGVSPLGYVPLGRTARTIVLVVAAFIAASILADLTSPADLVDLHVLSSFAIAILFGMFAWRPPVAAIALTLLGVAAVTLSALGLLDETAGPTLSGILLAAIFVALTCSLSGTVVYIGILWACGVVRQLVEPDTTSEMTFILIILSLVTVVIGASLRIVIFAHQATADELERATRAQAELLRDERERIADDLHDILAHDLTIVAMQARALGLSVDERTPRTSVESIDAITVASTRALDDVRRVIAATGEADATTDTIPNALSGAATTLRELGFAVHTRDEIGDVALGRLVTATLARTIREAATNIAKHGSPEAPVTFAVARRRDHLILDVVNGIRPDAVAIDAVASTSRGLARHRERARQLGGELTTSADGDTWTLHVELPIDSAAASRRADAARG
ncbi:sensor histidine kinase [Microbacterium karelineae]|uniref:sensor histidine kinase n=1 Tax=Microbacterium karelineae TaxID=2654283 RepID=UPI0012E9CE2D|nr:histidine kinase [Microbacterium karelineae]